MTPSTNNCSSQEKALCTDWSPATSQCISPQCDHASNISQEKKVLFCTCFLCQVGQPAKPGWICPKGRLALRQVKGGTKSQGACISCSVLISCGLEVLTGHFAITSNCHKTCQVRMSGICALVSWCYASFQCLCRCMK